MSYRLDRLHSAFRKLADAIIKTNSDIHVERCQSVTKEFGCVTLITLAVYNNVLNDVADFTRDAHRLASSRKMECDTNYAERICDHLRNNSAGVRDLVRTLEGEKLDNFGKVVLVERREVEPESDDSLRARIYAYGCEHGAWVHYSTVLRLTTISGDELDRYARLMNLERR